MTVTVTVSESRSDQIARAVSEFDLRKDVLAFASYGRALRRDPSLNLNTYGLQSGDFGTNGFVQVVHRIETRFECLLVPRVLLEGESRKHTDTIVHKWSELFKDGKPLRNRRVSGLTITGEGLTDYGTMFEAGSLLFDQLVCNRELPPERSVPFGLKGRIRIGGDNLRRREELSEYTAYYLATHAQEYGALRKSLKDSGRVPGTVLLEQDEAAAHLPTGDDDPFA